MFSTAVGTEAMNLKSGDQSVFSKRSRLNNFFNVNQKGLRNAQPLYLPYSILFLAVKCVFECIDKVEFFPCK